MLVSLLLFALGVGLCSDRLRCCRRYGKDWPLVCTRSHSDGSLDLVAGFAILLEALVDRIRISDGQ
jgi:hypothetical protein